jgi:formimidoylglutamase
MTLTRHLVLTDPRLFFSRRDPQDVRLGELVKRWDGHQDLRHFEVVLLGIPDDVGIAKSGGRVGAREAPQAVRKALYKFTPGCETPIKLSIVDVGDIEVSQDVRKTHQRVRRVVSQLAQLGIFPICIGGGHDLSYATFVGYAEALLKLSGSTKFGLINIDAHFDVRDLRFGITSGTPFFRVLEHHNLVRGRNFVVLGAQRHRNSPQYYKYLLAKGANIILLDEVRSRGIEAVAKQALTMASRHTRWVYVSFDLDVVGAAHAPGVSAPSPNGLSPAELERLAYLVGKYPRVGAVDIMEISPPLDEGGRTAELGASVIFHFLRGLAERKK